MGIDHGCLDIIVPEQLLNGSDVVAAFQEMSREGVAKGMYRCPLCYACLNDCSLEGFLEDARMSESTDRREISA